MKPLSNRQITIALIVTLSLVVANAAISAHNILKLINNEHWVIHTYKVLGKLAATFSTLKDAEMGQRGYLLTGKEQYLEPYNVSIKKVRKEVTTLQRLTVDNTKQQKNIKELEQTIDNKLAVLKKTIELQQNKGPEAALKLMETGKGKQLMDRIRQQVEVIKAEEIHLLHQRTEISKASRVSTLVTFTLAMLLNVLLLFLLYYLVIQHEARRQRQEQAQQELIIELKNSEAKFRQLAENISEIVFWISTSQNARIVYVSPAYELIWGRSCENLYADFFEWVEAIHPEDREQVKRNFFEQAPRGTYDQEYRIVRSDGAVRWIRDRRFPVRNEAGEPTYVVGIAEDFTERKESELQLKQQAANLSQLNNSLRETSSELAKRNFELDSFTHNVSHDLKAPLRAISNLAQWISDDLEEQLSEENQRQLQLLRSRVYRMDNLINGLLTYARIGRTEVAIERVNVNELIGEILDSLAPPASFTISVQPVMPTLLTRKVLLAQVFSNLISNAIKHCDRPDGRLEIRATQKEEYYEFSVADNGRGIAPKNHERVFRIFQTVKESDDSESTGIGLSIVKKIIETEGGEIFLESELGKGATFRFTWGLMQAS